MSWLYEGQEFLEIPDKAYGFVYIIHNLVSGKRYIGRKFFTKAGYKTVAGKRKKIRLESDWRDYYGSSPALARAIEAEGRENFQREIVRICYNRSECSYYESKMIFENDAILSDSFYNDWISCKISSRHVNAIKKNPK
jgi:Putative endonuclease segE, GIY-YIG domain